MKPTHTSWQLILAPMTTLVMTTQAVNDHSPTWVDPGFYIPDLNYPQLDTKNVKIGSREGVVRFWTKMGFLHITTVDNLKRRFV